MKPKFSTQDSVLSQKIKWIADYDNIYYEGEKVTTLDLVRTTITIRLNVRDVPRRIDALDSAAFQIAKLARQNLRDTSIYDTYKVEFYGERRAKPGNQVVSFTYWYPSFALYK